MKPKHNSHIKTYIKYPPFQSRRWPGSAVSNETFSNDDLLDRELFTLSRLIAVAARGRSAACTGVSVVLAA